MSSLNEGNVLCLPLHSYHSAVSGIEHTVLIFFIKFVNLFTKGMKWNNRIENLKKMNVQLSKREESQTLNYICIV